MKTLKILAISGSLRKLSFNSGLLRAAKELAPEGVEIEMVEIGHLPLFNADLESDFPKEVTELKNKIRSVDGILFASPEYNRSVSGVLKNFLDWTSRPYGDSAWDAKPVATIGGAPGNTGSALSQYALRQSLLYLDCRILGQPEFFVSQVKEKFDNQSNLTDAKTKEKLTELLKTFASFINQLAK